MSVTSVLIFSGIYFSACRELLAVLRIVLVASFSVLISGSIVLGSSFWFSFFVVVHWSFESGSVRCAIRSDVFFKFGAVSVLVVVNRMVVVGFLVAVVWSSVRFSVFVIKFRVMVVPIRMRMSVFFWSSSRSWGRVEWGIVFVRRVVQCVVVLRTRLVGSLSACFIVPYAVSLLILFSVVSVPICRSIVVGLVSSSVIICINIGMVVSLISVIVC